MKKFLGLLLALLFYQNASAAPPTPPMILYGQVWQKGLPVAEGAEVVFDFTGTKLIAPVIDSGLGYSFYSLEIPNQEMTDPRKEEIIRIIRVGAAELDQQHEVYRPGVTVAHHLDTHDMLPPQSVQVTAAEILREQSSLQLSCTISWAPPAESADAPEKFSIQWFAPSEEPDLPIPFGEPQVLDMRTKVSSSMAVPSTEVVSNRLYLVVIPIFSEDRKGQAVFKILTVPLGAEGEV